MSFRDIFDLLLSSFMHFLTFFCRHLTAYLTLFDSILQIALQMLVTLIRFLSLMDFHFFYTHFVKFYKLFLSFP